MFGPVGIPPIEAPQAPSNTSTSAKQRLPEVGRKLPVTTELFVCPISVVA